MSVSGSDHGADVRAAWGKARDEQIPHPLICHAIDTAAVAELLLPTLPGPRCRAAMRAAFEPLGNADGWIAVLCGLHDLGKLSPAFQALRADLAVNLLGESAVKDISHLSRFSSSRPSIGRTDTPHGTLTVVHLRRILHERWGASRGVADKIARALGGHHGIIPDSDEVRQARDACGHHGGKRWEVWCDNLVDCLVQLWGLPDQAGWPEVGVSAQAMVGLAGLTSISDWIASDRRHFEHAGIEVNLTDYRDAARQRASHALTSLNWSPWRPQSDTGFSALFPHAGAPRPVQEVVERVTDRLHGAGVVIVEAPTGEGKTKAALQCAATLVNRMELAGCYVAMPSRATSHQMLSEAEQMVDRSAEPLTVRLVHGAADDHLVARRLRQAQAMDAAEMSPSDVGTDEPGDGDAIAMAWFTRKRGLLAPVGVGTVDQALMAGIRSRHVFVRLLGLSGKVVVVDEVHAYDTYMSTLLERLLGWLGLLGVPVILLSATLPTSRRRALLQSWRAGTLGCLPHDVPDPPEAACYPCVTWADADGAGVEPAGVSELNAGRIVRLVHVGDEDLVEWLLKRIEEGGCAAVIHNLVRRAEATVTKLCDRVQGLPETKRPAVVLLHARLSAARRHRIETDLAEWLGPAGHETGKRPERLIVVASPLLGQSLDLDFDVMVSDLAPVDSIIQRMGRVHRHDRTRRRPAPVARPLLGLTGVTEGSNGPAFPPYTANVFSEALLMRTWALLRDRTEVRSPRDIPHLVDAVYGVVGAQGANEVYGPEGSIECPPGWEKRWNDAAKVLRTTYTNHIADARTLYLPPAHPQKELRELTERPKPPQTRRKGYRR